MSSLVYPTLPGLGWSVYRQPMFAVTLRENEAFREASEVVMTNCFYEFDLTYEMLRNRDSYRELDTIQSFFLAMRGGYDYFKFQDPNDYYVNGSLLGTGNGTNRTFIFARNTGPSYYEAVGYLNAVSAVYLNGVLQDPSSYTLSAPNVLTFTTAPAAGVKVTADFTYYYLCRFAEDLQQYDQFCSTMWELGQVKLKSVVM